MIASSAHDQRDALGLLPLVRLSRGTLDCRGAGNLGALGLDPFLVAMTAPAAQVQARRGSP
jgi:hypothetical protein